MIDLPGSRLRLRTLYLHDVEALFALDDYDPVPAAESREAALQQLRARLDTEPGIETTGMLFLGVETAGHLIGTIQARAPRYAFPPGVCELGLSLSGHSRGRGFGTEAVTVFTHYLFAQGWDRVQGSTALDNAAMRHALERAGYVFEGILRSFAPTDHGTRTDYALYASTRPVSEQPDQ